VLTHTWPWPPPGAGGLAASSLVRPAGIGRAARRAFLLAFAFLEVGFALGEAVGDATAKGDAAFSAGEGDAVGVGVATIGVSIAAGDAAFSAGEGDAVDVGVATIGVSIAAGDAAFSAGEGDAVDVGVATIGVSIVAGEFSRGSLFATYWAMAKTITAVAETIPTAIAQRVRRWVC